MLSLEEFDERFESWVRTGISIYIALIIASILLIPYYLVIGIPFSLLMSISGPFEIFFQFVFGLITLFVQIGATGLAWKWITDKGWRLDK